MSTSNMTTNEPLQMLQEVMITIERDRNIQNVAFVGTAIMVLEWLLTFEMEVTLIWKAEWNVMKGIYIASRYLPFIGVPVALIVGLGEGFSAEGCMMLYKCVTWMSGIGQVTADLIFTLRTWVVWGRTRRMGLCLVVCYIAIWVVILSAVGLYLRTLIHVPSPVPQLIGCLVQNSSEFVTVIYAAGTTYYAIMLVLILIPGISVWKHRASARPSGIGRVVYGDGIKYYIFIFALSLLNLIVTLKLPEEYTTLLIMCVDAF
ncbi:hypothetical protein P691DRAFT_765896 [Macrolepiota fuliginosa MF-IS2]|uniref:DUF6533 domain-containing protein n=1 Tax=Macrolepiota fuliginosa MF-IS2 TaxID=1400762 RepID=A0A9P5X1A9_9AGAR|nr:hypothetical protein P691DRAFT_765896 [Macrolepiota fuliginosa MF-IS2]